MNILLHVDLVVRDMEASLAFYVGKLGCAVVEDTRLVGPSVEFYTGGAAREMRLCMLRVTPPGMSLGAMLELMQFFPAEGKAPVGPRPRGEAPLWPSVLHVTLAVEDLQETLDALREAGVEPASPIFDIELPQLGSSRIAFIHDPDENLIELMES